MDSVARLNQYLHGLFHGLKDCWQRIEWPETASREKGRNVQNEDDGKES
jgi:hypothetical protein